MKKSFIPLGPDCADVQADLRLRWAHKQSWKCLAPGSFYNIPGESDEPKETCLQTDEIWKSKTRAKYVWTEFIGLVSGKGCGL